ncbi:fumarate reductase/succinate dehydrogenase flavoprotein domain protein [Ktedonobacter racemifer DSM 44963]|uniref:Fumarate reductase/succinate dehydrogenase flavoprotein domain protein n=1 Tax=Ktedonobacter racemifer DSM 44963 TaxID=485913 RepID=D6TM65_KTERA|nr:fumarate reductase/succinate dehydrogenase flavoprotein domain protein [Ktedonobacter racemifer DSM 44963]
MHENASPGVERDDVAISTPHASRQIDAIIIGAGLGGLLSAAHLLQRGKRVLILERLPHAGGRFTAKHFQGVQVSTGAVHMVPFGSSGALAQMLDRLQVPHRFFDADVFGSFYVHGKQYRAQGLLGVLRFLGPRQSWWFIRLGYLMFFSQLPEAELQMPFHRWLERHLKVERNPQLVAFFERISRFALSLELSQVSTREVIRTTRNMFRFGAPAIVEGGCGEITRQLEQHVQALGGELTLSCEVLQIIQRDGRVSGVRVRYKEHGVEEVIEAPLVVSDIGPRATDGLLHNRKVRQADVLKRKPEEESVGGEMPSEVGLHEAVGLKVHILSDVSFIPHRGIMYCLDTKRIAGIVQPTNSDPSLAPAGKHLLITHQVIQSNNVEEERALALADLHMLFGDAFDTHCRVLTMGTYRGEWPVNRMTQGEDLTPTTTIEGLYLVGDAVKPSGFLMVEGVAQSVNHFLDLLDALDREETDRNGRPARASRSHMAVAYSRLNPLRWLWMAPGNSATFHKLKDAH